MWRGEAHFGKIRIGKGSTPKRMDNGLWSVSMTVGAEAANVITVACQAKNAHDQAVDVPVAARFYLATDAAGLAPATTAPTGGVAAGTNGALAGVVGNLSGIGITQADGTLDIALTDTGAPTFYLVFVLPDGKLAVSDAITFV